MASAVAGSHAEAELLLRRAACSYLQAIITEAMRLYPPVPFDGRVMVRDDVLPSGAALQAGWYANYSAYAMGRMEKLWGEDCLEFVPERWLGERGMKRSVWL